MSNFYLNQEDKFIIYGAGGNCYHLISALEQQGKQIVGIIDKRADSLQDVMGIPVYSMEQIQTLGLENAVIILSIKNVFMHTEIAEQLVQLGFSKLIYKPLPILQGIEDGEWKSVDKVYDALVEHEIFLGDIGVFFSDKNHMRVWQNRLLISRTDEGVICWLPIELLHNYDRENDIFARLPMAAYYPLVQLYSFLLGNKTGLTWNEVQRDYLLYSAEWVYKRQLEFTNDLKKSQIDSRVQVFYEMQQNAELDQEFFLRNAAEVRMGNRGSFFLSSSGRNRVAFLVAKGYRYIPVKMKCADYEQFICQEQYERVLEYLQVHDIRKLFSLIPHPILREYPTVANDYSRLFCMPVILEIIRWLHNHALRLDCDYEKIDGEILLKKMDKLKVAAFLDDEGMFSRLIAKENITCYRVLSVNEWKKKELIHRIDELMQTSDCSYLQEVRVEDFELLPKVDVLVLDAFYSSYYIGNSDTEMVFLLLYERDISALKQWEEKGYRSRCFFSSVWNGEQVSGYQMMKKVASNYIV